MCECYVILENIRSVHNVGSIFRTAEAAGVTRIYLVGTTPAPVDRFGRSREDLAKVALGAEKLVPWESVSEIRKLLEKLHQEKVQIVSVEQTQNAENYQRVKGGTRTAFIFGNEIDGVSKEALTLSDQVVEIPMKGEKESLNVSVTVGVVLFSALN